MAQGVILEARQQPVTPPEFFLWDEQHSIPTYHDQRYQYRQFGTVLAGVEKAVYEGAELAYWDPGRVVEGIVSFKIKHPEAVDDTVELVDGAMQVAVGVHAGSVNLDALELLGNTTEGSPKLRHSQIRDTRSASDVRASSPEYSEATAKALRKVTGNADLLMIALGNFGITAGINTFLSYQRAAKGADSAIYPVRLSGHRRHDTSPRINPQEIDYLRGLATTADKVAVVDETCATGFTLGLATNFFSQLLDTEVIPVANYDYAEGERPIIGTAALCEIQQRSYNQHHLAGRPGSRSAYV